MSASRRTTAGTMRPLGLRRRRDLEVVSQVFEGRTVWAVKDPIRLRYYHLRDEEYCLFSALDGTVSIADLQEQFERQFAPRRLLSTEIQAFLGMLHREGLILADAAGQAVEFAKRAQAEKWRKLRESIGNILAIRIRGIDPQRTLDVLDSACRWMFTPAAVAVALAVMFAALIFAGLKFESIKARWPDIQALWTPATVVWLSVALALSKVVHELGHALVCRRYGRDCHELGLLFLVFTPCLYCNVSDSWMLESKWQRAAVGAAGVLVDLVLAAVCFFLWWFSEPGLFNSLCFHLMFVCSISTLLFNANPLMRYDGYFILADLIETPNLAQQSALVLRDWLGFVFLGVPPRADQGTTRRKRIVLALYAAASITYRVTITVGILLFLYSLLKPYRLEILAEALAIPAAFGLFAEPALRTGKFLKEAAHSRQINRRRAWLSGAAVIALLALALFIPFPFRVTAPTYLEAKEAKHIYVTIPGILTESVDLGQAVEQNERIALLQNPDLQLEIARLAGKRNEQQQRLENLKRRLVVDASVAPLILPAEEALADFEDRLARRQDEARRLVLQSPTAGVVLPVHEKPRNTAAGELSSWVGNPLDVKNRGSWLETGTLLCQVGDPKAFEAVVILDQRDIDFVSAGQTVWIQLEQSPGQLLQGTIVEIAEIDLKTAPVELIPSGLIPTRPDENGVQRPVSVIYQARVALESPPLELLIGQTGQARIEAAPQSFFRRILRYFSRTFRFEY